MSNKNKYIIRFTPLNRTLHFFMIISFIILALTGMSLKFSYTNWAKVLSAIFGGYESAGYLHRFAAIIMIIVFTTHIVNLFILKHKEFGSWKKMLFGYNSMLFNKKDIHDFRDSLKWFLGRGERPEYGRWTYWEKFDYFAVFWGMFVISSTGLTLWFPEFFTKFLPGWILNVTTIIHSDEALLAVGFIFTVHFFNTHLRPEKFPMDIVIFSGRIPLEEFKIDRPDEYKKLVENGTLENYLSDQYPPSVLRLMKIFGWCALITGFSIVLLIIYAMLFSYR